MQDYLIKKDEKIVVVFDMVSSAEIFENLLSTGDELKFFELWTSVDSHY